MFAYGLPINRYGPNRKRIREEVGSIRWICLKRKEEKKRKNRMCVHGRLPLSDFLSPPNPKFEEGYGRPSSEYCTVRYRIYYCVVNSCPDLAARWPTMSTYNLKKPNIVIWSLLNFSHVIITCPSSRVLRNKQQRHTRWSGAHPTRPPTLRQWYSSTPLYSGAIGTQLPVRYGGSWYEWPHA